MPFGHFQNNNLSRAHAKGVVLSKKTCFCLLGAFFSSPFLEPLLRTLLRTLLPIKAHCKTDLLRTLLRTSSKAVSRTLLRTLLRRARCCTTRLVCAYFQGYFLPFTLQGKNYLARLNHLRKVNFVHVLKVLLRAGGASKNKLAKLNNQQGLNNPKRFSENLEHLADVII